MNWKQAIEASVEKRAFYSECGDATSAVVELAKNEYGNYSCRIREVDRSVLSGLTEPEVVQHLRRNEINQDNHWHPYAKSLSR